MAARVFLVVCAGIIDVLLLARMIWGPTGLVEYQALKTQHQGLQARILELDEVNRSLSRDIRLLQTDRQYVEKMIRQRLHYLRGNEMVYLFRDDVQTGARANDGKD